MIGNQVLPDGHGIPTTTESLLDQIAERLALTGPPTRNRDRATSECEPFRDLIEQGLGCGRNAMAIWQDLVTDHGFPHGYQTVKRFVRKLRGAMSPEAAGIICTAVG